MNYQLAEEEATERRLQAPGITAEGGCATKSRRPHVAGTLSPNDSLVFGPITVALDYDGRNIRISFANGDGLRFVTKTGAIFRRLCGGTEFLVALNEGAEQSIHIGASRTCHYLIISRLLSSLAVMCGDNRLMLWPRGRKPIRFTAVSDADHSPILQQGLPLCVCGQGGKTRKVDSLSEFLET